MIRSKGTGESNWDFPGPEIKQCRVDILEDKNDFTFGHIEQETYHQLGHGSTSLPGQDWNISIWELFT